MEEKGRVFKKRIKTCYVPSPHEEHVHYVLQIHTNTNKTLNEMSIVITL